MNYFDHNIDLRHAMKNVRQKMKNNYEVNKEFGVVIGVETFIFSSLITYIGVSFFNWNGYATFFISLVAMLFIVFSSFYPVLTFIFSIGWGYLGYKLVNIVSTYMGANDFFSSIVGVVGFLLAFFISSSIRSNNRQYTFGIGN